MKKHLRKLLIALGIILVAGWFFDPTAIRLRLRYPHAKVSDCHDDRWILPAFLHARWASPDDLHSGRYLHVELSDQSTAIDFSGFTELPVFLVALTRCRPTDLQPILSCPHPVCVVFNDCDLSALPELQRRELYPLPGTNRFSLNGP